MRMKLERIPELRGIEDTREKRVISCCYSCCLKKLQLLEDSALLELFYLFIITNRPVYKFYFLITSGTCDSIEDILSSEVTLSSSVTLHRDDSVLQSFEESFLEELLLGRDSLWLRMLFF